MRQSYHCDGEPRPLYRGKIHALIGPWFALIDIAYIMGYSYFFEYAKRDMLLYLIGLFINIMLISSIHMNIGVSDRLHNLDLHLNESYADAKELEDRVHRVDLFFGCLPVLMWHFALLHTFFDHAQYNNIVNAFGPIALSSLTLVTLVLNLRSRVENYYQVFLGSIVVMLCSIFIDILRLGSVFWLILFLTYISGLICKVLRRPNIIGGRFEYHEMMHFFVVLAHIGGIFYVLPSAKYSFWG